MKSRILFPAHSVSVVSKARLWIVLAGVLAFLCAGSAESFAQSAKSFYKRGQDAEAREDFDGAFQNFQKAYTMAPKNEVYRTAYLRVRFTDAAMHVTKGRSLEASGDQQAALVELLRAAEIDPSNEAAQQEIAKIRTKLSGQAPVQANSPVSATTQADMDAIGSPVQLRPMNNEPFLLRMTEDSKTVYQAIGKAAGINVLFDPDYISKRIQVDLNNVSLMDALRIVGTLSGTFWRPITQNTIFVAANTRSKRAELDEQAVQTFYLSNAWQQNDLNDVQTALRNVLPNAKVYGVASQNAIVMRATPDELLLAQKLVTDLDKARPEVVVDIGVLEVSKNWERNLGISWPSSASVQLQSPSASTSTTCPTGSTNCTPTTSTNNLTLYNLAHLNSNDFAVTVGQATANALLTDNNTHILQNPRIRAADQQKATMKIGSRIPIATGSYQTGAATALVSSLVNTQFQYQDVGVNIEITPTVHYDRDITLKMRIEVTAQSGSVTISGVTEPILSQRVAEQTIRLREGEANILGGINEQQIQDNWSGIPGLSQIPILRYLFGSHDKIRQDDEIVFLVVPHVVRSQDLTPLNLRSIDTGSGLNVELRHASAPVQPPVSQAAPAAARPNYGTVQGASAEGAANTALNQMKSTQDAALAPPAASSPAAAQPPAQAGPPGNVNLMLNSPGTVANGTTFQVPVVLTGGTDVSAVPLQVQYDPSKLSLVNVGDGDLLNRDGQVVQMAHRDDGPGDLTVNVARAPGAPGVSGAGVVCVLTFQAKASGSTNLSITRGGAMNSAGKPLQAQTSQATLNVQ
ncbi:cohesin domain-containing protein [Occallatibacter savannae]|uniref:cohesin domain-containing protein n=1 Tax=Occallatibacter savannae TaxID=1002691 RepID=UPI000D687969|nr:cohesin domain-containing protein [Occallatibacter savannae]